LSAGDVPSPVANCGPSGMIIIASVMQTNWTAATRSTNRRSSGSNFKVGFARCVKVTRSESRAPIVGYHFLPAPLVTVMINFAFNIYKR
jgi:hypothetical protein